MNYLILISALLALFAVIGHFTIGKKEYLRPVLSSEVDAIPKNIVLSLFHYMSVFMVVSVIILLAGSSPACPLYDYVRNMIRLIGLLYGLFGVTQLIIALTSGIPNGAFKLFQWVFWLLICGFSLLGTLS